MDVALVGVSVPGVENHSVAVLGKALADAGFDHSLIAFRGFAGMTQMVTDVLRLGPRICGLSLQTSESALAALVFTRLLREHGFAGTIVVGGHFASLCADELLAAPAGVDVVVELAGEAALVGLARGIDALELPGTVTRQGRGGAPIAVMPRAMRRERLSEHLGFGAADLLVSRGCEAHCGYCCVAAVSTRAQDTGNARHVAREIDAIADEIAGLAKRGARAFHFMDDNILPLDPARATGWANALLAALADRRVPPIAFSLQLRADVVTPELADALVALGLARAYVGIDGYTAGQLRAIGRSSPASAATRALAELAQRGVLCVANALLVGPTIRFETIVAEIEGLAAVRHAPVHLLPIEARPGTAYHKRASARGLIEGGPLWPAYRFEDERSFFVSQVVTGLPTRLVERSVPIALYDLAWGLGVARRLAPQVDVAAAIETYAAVTTAWNADQIRILRAAAAAAVHGQHAIDELLAREAPIVRAHDEALLRACDRALADVEHSVSALHRRRVTSHARGRLLGGLAMTMGLASACGDDYSPAPAGDAAADTYVNAQADAMADAPVCADPTLGYSSWPSDLEYDCTCTDMRTEIEATFDADGEITSITGPSGQPLPPQLERCLLELVKAYCYPSLAGKTQALATCHMWIA